MLSLHTKPGISTYLWNIMFLDKRHGINNLDLKTSNKNFEFRNFESTTFFGLLSLVLQSVLIFKFALNKFYILFAHLKFTVMALDLNLVLNQGF